MGEPISNQGIFNPSRIVTKPENCPGSSMLSLSTFTACSVLTLVHRHGSEETNTPTTGPNRCLLSEADWIPDRFWTTLNDESA